MQNVMNCYVHTCNSVDLDFREIKIGGAKGRAISVG